ncbi:zinc-binding alcohol dehydrogenase family protein [Accumulibacter sp.]|uniref:zinc-binding alcohol dehydrogenase family protein n=1 Tax=Accumulibacter sp. TaxID=2053492 RepID=UPI002BFCA16C|nr:zinc-binding alcohol dehydrogenase family protein [Accumulibacter sp.]HNC27903.1 zinc-binding alcohol dehydrogenase family protein [Accumulibacter sp.]HNG15899.1 zinc-binding alcohol dehydrogenase family protein [Accumulibacter sp.]HNI50570.1 zinc-binding alcohol dehydrogenase family protein [Accumulibacter sp.]
MKAVGYQKTLPIEDPASLQEVELREPVASGHDLLVEVKAISVNPVDVKIRAGRTPPAGEWGVLGWDAAGIVRAVGPQVSLFRPGDRVWYAGDITRAGSNAELQAVDERIVGHLPCTLDFAQAAALPLTAITAWEMLFDRLRIAPGKRPTDERLLIVGAGGGVGSILVQLARRLTGLTVIGTASRAETQSWVRELGAHHVLDHSRPLADELKRIGFADVSHVVSLTHSEEHFAQIVEVLAPQGCFGLIDDPATPLDVRKLKAKSVSLHWELMFTRSLFQTADMIAQHRLLCELAALVDAGLVRTTLGEHYGRIDAANLRRAHALIEAGKARGKIVLEAF